MLVAECSYVKHSDAYLTSSFWRRGSRSSKNKLSTACYRLAAAFPSCLQQQQQQRNLERLRNSELSPPPPPPEGTARSSYKWVKIRGGSWFPPRREAEEKHGLLPDHIAFWAAPRVARPVGAARRQRSSVFVRYTLAETRRPVCVRLSGFRGFCEECFLGPRKCKRTQTRGRGREMESFAVFLPSCPLLIERGREVVYGLLQASSALLTLVRRNNKASLQPCVVAVLLYFSSRVMATPLNPSNNWSRLSLDLSQLLCSTTEITILPCCKMLLLIKKWV